MALAAGTALGLPLPRKDKRLLVIVETDGCFADGVEIASGAALGHRTLRLEDYGKIAATFIDTKTGRAIRLAPLPDARERAHHYAPYEKRRYFAQLHGYQIMPLEELLSIQEVRLAIPISQIVSRAGVRTRCAICNEEIINQRELHRGEQVYCRACAGPAYYLPCEEGEPCHS